MSEEEKTVPRASVEKTSKKRKRDAQVTNDLESSKRAQKSTHRNETSGDEVNPLIAQMDPSLLSDHIAQKTKRFRPDISLVEADDLHISKDRILDTTSYQPIRTADNLSSFVEQFSKSSTSGKKVKLSVAPNAKGSPHTIIVAAAGLRAADLTRAVRQFQTKDSMVAKLFAKHIKLKEASDMVKKSRIGIGVGTPQRIIDLLENGSLSTDFLDRIIIDASHINQKKQGILDIKEIQTPLITLLNRPDIRGSGEKDKKATQLLFF